MTEAKSPAISPNSVRDAFLSDAEYELIFAALSGKPADQLAELRRLAYPPPPPQPEGYTYFVSDGVGPIKIGFAMNVKTRLKALSTGSPVKLKVLATRRGPARVERFYHKRFAAHRLHGEWFSRHPDILAEIDRLAVAGNDA